MMKNPNIYESDKIIHKEVNIDDGIEGKPNSTTVS